MAELNIEDIKWPDPSFDKVLGIAINGRFYPNDPEGDLCVHMKPDGTLVIVPACSSTESAESAL